MTGRVRRRAFLLGCNSAGLEHCERDAQRFGAVLTDLGYQVQTYLAPTAPQARRSSRRPVDREPTAVVSDALRKFLHDDCQPNDTALIYFSGHSRFEYNIFNLVVGNDHNDRGHLLNVEVLVGLLRQDLGRVDSVLILDCCEAGAAVTPDFWHVMVTGVRRARVWVPVGAEHYAWEHDGPAGGSWFTHWIIEALTEAAPRLAQAGGVRINAVDRFVQSCAMAHGSVPVPGVHGFTGDDLLLAEWTTGFPQSAQDELLRLLGASGLPPGAWSALYDEVRHHAGLSPADDYRGATAARDLPAAVANLAAAWYRPFPGVRVQVPLAEFVERVARVARNALDLRVWLHQQLQPLAGRQAITAFIESLALGQTASAGGRPRPRSHLAIALTPRDANRPTHYSVEARLVDAQGRGNRVDEGDTDQVPLGSMPHLLARVLNSPAVLDMADGPPAIEIFLPTHLCAAIEVDDWTLSDADQANAGAVRPLSFCYPVTVRAQSRLRPAAGGAAVARTGTAAHLADWRSHWRACAPCRERPLCGPHPAIPDCCRLVEAPPAATYWSLLDQGVCIFVLGFSPDRTGTDLDLMLADGVAVILWGETPLDHGVLNELLTEVIRSAPHQSTRQACLANLPQALLRLRKRRWEQSGAAHTGRLHLLWDDPDRIPAFTGCPAAAAAGSVAPPVARLQCPY